MLAGTRILRIARANGAATAWSLSWDHANLGGIFADDVYAYAAMPGCAAITRIDKETAKREEMTISGVAFPTTAGVTALAKSGSRLLCASPTEVFAIDGWGGEPTKLISGIRGLFGFVASPLDAFWLSMPPEATLPSMGSIPILGGDPLYVIPAEGEIEAGFTPRLVYSSVVNHVLYGSSRGVRGLDATTKRLDALAECCPVAADLAADDTFVYGAVSGFRARPEEPQGPGTRASWLVRIPLAELHTQTFAVEPSGPPAPPDCPDISPLVPVASGEFTLGPGGSSKQVATDVTLPDAYEIDMTEVSVRAYGKCVEAGACPVPSLTSCNYGFPGADCQPMNCVTQAEAAQYCTWAGRALPTAEELEFAARGTDGRTFPWGNDAPTDDLVCWSGTKHRTQTCEIGSRPLGASPVGALDLSGNVREWTAGSACTAYPGGSCSGYDCASSQCKSSLAAVFGGGFVDDTPLEVESPFQISENPSSRITEVGFRCVRRLAR